MNNDNQRLARLERKVDWILRAVGVQLVFVVGSFLWFVVRYFFQLASSVAIVFVIAVPLLFVYRKSLPQSVVATLRRGCVFFLSLFRFKNESIQEAQEV